MNKMKNH